MWTKQCLFISGKLVHECPNAFCASDRGATLRSIGGLWVQIYERACSQHCL